MVHLGIIPDGNRRYALKYNISKKDAYIKGFDLLKYFLQELWLVSESNSYSRIISKINMLSIYVCSLDNVTKRNEEDKENIFCIIRMFISFFEEKNEEIHLNEIKIHVAGNYTTNNLLPEDIVKSLSEMEESTKNYNRYTLNLAICYDSRREVLRSLNRNPKNISELYSGFFVTKDIDAVIRTGGEFRTSGFFPMQTLYSEWFFCDLFWPELTFEKLKETINQFEMRERRLGK